MSKKIKSIGGNAFTRINSDVVVYVPSNKYKTYVNLIKKAGIPKGAEFIKNY